MRNKIMSFAVAVLAFCAGSEAFSKDTLTDFTIEVNYVFPSSLPSYPTTDGYTLSVKDGIANAYLPFVGSSDIPIFGTDELSYVFKDCPVKLKTKEKKESTIYKFKAKSGNESVDVTVELWSNGEADITCFSASRSIMRYRGELGQENQTVE